MGNIENIKFRFHPTIAGLSKFFTFEQSCLDFEIDRKFGKYFIVEAVNSLDANARAQLAGIVFDGDRWHEQFMSEKGTPLPDVHGYNPHMVNLLHLNTSGAPIIILYMNGRKEVY